MNLHDMARHRLHNQRLSRTDLGSAESVIGWLGAVQAQDYAPGKWSVGQRALDLSDVQLDEALAAGRIIRTHILRPTWHFVLPADIRWMMSLTAPRVHGLNRHWLKVAGLDPATIERATEVLVAALRGKRLTRAEVRDALETAGIATSGQRLGYILMQAELDLLICSGGLRGRQQTYALLDEVAPSGSRGAAGGAWSRDEALAELTRRYFTSRGPATIHDFTWWSSLTVADARHGIELAGTALERRQVDGLELWATTFDPPVGTLSPRAHFIQGLDEYFVGYQKSRGVADVARMGLQSRGFVNGFFHALVMDGQICGAVRRVAERGGGVTFQTRLMRALQQDERVEMQAAADRYSAFLGAPVGIEELD